MIRITVNGELRSAEVEGCESLLHVLRERFHQWGSKNACDQGECGACSIFLDGDLVCSCLVLAAAADGCEVVTVEGIGSDLCGRRVQEAMVEAGAVQCGFCTPGFVMAITDLLKRSPHPGPLEVREALAGNLCRCTGYVRILGAVAMVAEGADR